MRPSIFLVSLLLVCGACNRQLLRAPTIVVNADAPDTYLLTDTGERVELPARVSVSHFADSVALTFVRRRDTSVQIVRGQTNLRLSEQRYVSTLYTYPYYAQFDWNRSELLLDAPLRHHLYLDLRLFNLVTTGFRDLSEPNISSFSLARLGLYYGYTERKSIGITFVEDTEFCRNSFGLGFGGGLRNFVRRTTTLTHQFQLRSGSSFEAGLSFREFRLERNAGNLARSDCERRNFTEQSNPFAIVENHRPGLLLGYTQRLNDRLGLYAEWGIDLGGDALNDELGRLSYFHLGFRYRPAEFLIR